jgi:hypothetical protein
MHWNMEHLGVAVDMAGCPNRRRHYWLENLKTDGVDVVIKAYRNEATPAMKTNREIPIAILAHKFGVSQSKS